MDGLSLYNAKGLDYYSLMKKLRLALAQINPRVGDLDGNTRKIIRAINKAKMQGADIVALPELAVTGYPPEDLLLKPSFIEDNLEAFDRIRETCEGITAVVGFVDRTDDIYNAAAVVSSKKIIDVYHKMHLPNYGPFDEVRYFQKGARVPVYLFGKVIVGINICEDMWYPEEPARLQALAGAELIININASPYTMGKVRFREQMLATRATDNVAIVAFLNTVGGQDELVFDGGSFVVNEQGEFIARGAQFKEDLVVADLDIEGVFMKRLHDPRRRQHVLKLKENKVNVEMVTVPSRKKPGLKKSLRRKTRPSAIGREEEIYSALGLGLSDYVGKNGFQGGLIGLSGGIDSALVATIAVDALGKENVKCIFMPSRYTSKESAEDSRKLTKNLAVELIEIPIDALFESYLAALKEPLKGYRQDTTEENIQARIRGNLLMAFSNKLGWIVLATGNKSEMSVGYATLYGDMAGGFAVIKDVSKTLVYELAKWRNERSGAHPPIPERILWKEPSAELRADQKDTDTLPPYPVLDPILQAYIEKESSFEEIVEVFHCEPDCVRKVVGMIDRNEYKRRQSPPGIKITPRAFGKDRRFPITNLYRESP